MKKGHQCLIKRLLLRRIRQTTTRAARRAVVRRWMPGYRNIFVTFRSSFPIFLQGIPFSEAPYVTQEVGLLTATYASIDTSATNAHVGLTCIQICRCYVTPRVVTCLRALNTHPSVLAHY